MTRDETLRALRDSWLRDAEKWEADGTDRGAYCAQIRRACAGSLDAALAAPQGDDAAEKYEAAWKAGYNEGKLAVASGVERAPRPTPDDRIGDVVATWRDRLAEHDSRVLADLPCPPTFTVTVADMRVLLARLVVREGA